MDETEQLILNLRNDVQHLRKENEFLRKQLEGVSPGRRTSTASSVFKSGSPASSSRSSPAHHHSRKPGADEVNSMVREYTSEIDRLQAALAAETQALQAARDLASQTALENEG